MEKLLSFLEEKYRKETKKSLASHMRAEKVMVGGGSHTVRLFRPYPFVISRAKGPYVFDTDGNTYIDYWQGHYANILGHNPEIIRREVSELYKEGSLQSGFEGQSQLELAELLLSRLGNPGHKIRFTTSGTLAAMYAVMLAKAFTGREYILKIGGGWHGASPYLLKGIKYNREMGFEGGESAGVQDETLKKTLITRFNDCEDLEKVMKERGEAIACFILEPFLGAGGFLPASGEYLRLARALTEKHGAVLIFDEIVSGFRFCPSGVQQLYGVRPDLSCFGKVIGGGHAVAAVVGREDIMERCRPGHLLKQRVLFEGGTFSAHSEYMKSGLVMVKHLIENADRIYPKLAESGENLRRSIEEAFLAEGMEVRCTGFGNDVVRGSSLFMVNFPLRKGAALNPDNLLNEDVFDVRMKEEVLKLALLTEGVHVVHGGGAVSVAHEGGDLDGTVSAYAAVARLFKKFL